MEQPEFSDIAGKSINGTTTLIEGLAISYEIKHIFTYDFTNSNERRLTKRNGIHMVTKIFERKYPWWFYLY